MGEARGATITSDAGLLAYREFDSALGLTGIAKSAYTMRDTARTRNIRCCERSYGSREFSRLAGYEDTNHADRLSVDPAMRQAMGGRVIDRTAASTSQVERFETEILTLLDNRTALMNLSGSWIDRLRQRMPMRKIVLDMDSSVSETYGRQEGAAFNGHFGCNDPI